MAPRTDFPEHPYTPYPIQQTFMENLYQTLEESSIGLFESPTGTGKTISIICGALHWLEDFREHLKEALVGRISGGDGDDDPDWLRGHEVTNNSITEVERHPWLKRRSLDAPGARRVINPQSLGAIGAAHRSRERSARAAIAFDSSGDGKDNEDEDEQFLLAHTSADGSGGAGDGGSSVGARRQRVQALLEGDGSSEEEGGYDVDDVRAALRALRGTPAPPARKPQIFFASRTHSQLAQFVGELRKTGFASRLRLVSLASRRGLCVHEPVAALGTVGLITERCTELQERKKVSSGSKARRAVGSEGNIEGCGGAASSCGGDAGGPRRSAAHGLHSKGRGNRESRGGCPFLAPSLDAAEEFAGMVLGEPMDVEDLGRIGRRLGLCPYYGSRSLVSEADVVALPYSALLSQETCTSLGLRLEGSVVIFDEAHNLVDAVTGTHGSQVSLEQLKTAVRQLASYFSRFQMRLSPTSARNVQLLIRLTTSLQRCFETLPPQEQQQQQQRQSPQQDEIVRGPSDPRAPHEAAGTAESHSSSGGGGGVVVFGTHDFLLATRMEHLNLFPLISWVRESRLVMKVAGYDMATSGTAAVSAAANAEAMNNDDEYEKGAVHGAQCPSAGQRRRITSAAGGGFGARRSALFALISFLNSLTQPNADGRIVITRAAGNGGDASGTGIDACVRYTVLNAAAHFKSILQSARSVVLASGTLSPVDGLVAQLLPDVPRNRVRHFSCGHVVPPENLLALVAARGPTGQELDLRHGRRSDPRVCEELGRLLVNICTVVPAGVVVFVPSFAYLDQLVSAWRRSDVWSGLASRKNVFMEPRSSSEVEALLEAYMNAIGRTAPRPLKSSEHTAAGAASTSASAAAGAISGDGRRPNGAVLLCVVGGKLSEGINFGDELGRCVVVVGLPYPNQSDPELRERMRYLDAAAEAPSEVLQTASLPPSPRLTGRQYYEGLCIKAVNQCVGRVIRHSRDYAAIVLADARYMPQPGGVKTAIGSSATETSGGGRVGGGVVGSLPTWIQQSLQSGTGTFPHVYSKLVAFFRSRAAAAIASSSDAPEDNGHLQQRVGAS